MNNAEQYDNINHESQIAFLIKKFSLYHQLLGI